MENPGLRYVKLIHTLIWVGFNLIILYLFYAVLTNQVGPVFWLGVGAIALEVLVLIWYKWECPLTGLARRYTDDTSPNFDIYLPVWLARHNKTIYTIVMVILAGIYVGKILL